MTGPVARTSISTNPKIVCRGSARSISGRRGSEHRGRMARTMARMRRRNSALVLLTWFYLGCAAAVSAEQFSVNDAWKFRFDLTNAGSAGGWEAPGLDDRGWQIVQAGKAWNSFGYFGYSGIGWYRKKI